jgi:DNA polymerase III subunit epsilon
MREVVLDTETTGLDARKGDRLIEIGCIELFNRNPTGVEFHAFLSPEDRPVHPDAERIHGLTTAFLKDKPLFSTVAPGFLEFIGTSTLVIHNANFDVGFINMELERIGLAPVMMDRVVDTLALARRKHPAGPNTLDALCKRYGVDNTKRTKHGAIVDSLLLAQVYVELLGERQATLGLARDGSQGAGVASGRLKKQTAKARPQPLEPRLTPAQEDAHQAFVGTLGENAMWKRYLG